jgi:hypothetical protein
LRAGYLGETYGPPTDPAVVKLGEHEHDPIVFIDKVIGDPFLGDFMSSLVYVHRSGVPDLCE